MKSIYNNMCVGEVFFVGNLMLEIIFLTCGETSCLVQFLLCKEMG